MNRFSASAGRRFPFLGRASVCFTSTFNCIDTVSIKKAVRKILPDSLTQKLLTIMKTNSSVTVDQ